MNETVELVRELVEMRTVKDRPDELERCCDRIQDFFSDTGLVVRRYTFNDKPSLVIATSDTTEPRYMLHGHIDVVEADEDLFNPRTEDDRMYGRGTADMKGGVACLMQVMRRLAQQDDPPETALVIVSDEEIGGFDGMKRLVDRGYRPDFAISAEPTDPGDTLQIVTKQKGRFAVDITVQGEAAHASRPWNGDNALENLHDIYEQVGDVFGEPGDDHWTTTMTPTTIKGGDATNKVMDSVTARIDVRYTDELRPESIKEQLNQIDDLDYDVVFEEPMLQTSEGDPHVQRLKTAAEQVTGRECVFTHEHYASDMRFLTEHGIPAVVFGPQGANIHGDDEYLELDSLETFTAIIEAFLAENDAM